VCLATRTHANADCTVQKEQVSHAGIPSSSDRTFPAEPSTPVLDRDREDTSEYVYDLYYRDTGDGNPTKVVLGANVAMGSL
jgi:hypothetical protein